MLFGKNNLRQKRSNLKPQLDQQCPFGQNSFGPVTGNHHRPHHETCCKKKGEAPFGGPSNCPSTTGTLGHLWPQRSVVQRQRTAKGPRAPDFQESLPAAPTSGSMTSLRPGVYQQSVDSVCMINGF